MNLRRVGFVALLLVSACASSRPRSTPSSTTVSTMAASTRSTTSTTSSTSSTVATVPSPDAPCTGADTPSHYDHVIWIWMENHRRGQVIGAHDAPFVTRLAAGCASATDYRAVGSPSLPNYLGAVSGDTHGVRDDGAPARHPLDADNLFRQVRSSGRTAVSYQEAMPTPCALNSSGRYAVKHNPAAYFVGADDRGACQRDDVALGTVDAGPLADALAHDTLAAFTFVTPDLCNDTHDCAVATGDAWLSRWVSRILASRAYASGSIALFLVWDEPTPMPFIAIAPSIRPGTVVTDTTSHYALLRTTEELLGITTFLGQAAGASSLVLALHL